MKKFTYLILVLAIPLCGCPKGVFEGEMTERVKKVEIPGASVDFKNLMIEVAIEIDRCGEAPEKCTDLPDPWKEGKMLTLQKQIDYVRENPESSEVQLKMARLERAMLDAEGGSLLTPGNTFTVFGYNAGYGFENIVRRMERYLSILSETKK